MARLSPGSLIAVDVIAPFVDTELPFTDAVIPAAESDESALTPAATAAASRERPGP